MDKKMPRMPRDDDFVEEKRPRKGKQPVDPGSEDSDSEDIKKSKQLVRRDKMEVAKGGKSRRPRGDSDDDEEEMIVTKTVRKKRLDIDDIDDGFVALLAEAFRVREDKVASWCEKDLIKWDNKTNEYDVSKILDREDDKDVRWFNNQYKKYKKEWQMPAEDAAPGRSSRAPNIIIDNRPMYGGGGGWGHTKARPRYDPLCDDCYLLGVYCRDPYHGR